MSRIGNVYLELTDGIVKCCNEGLTWYKGSRQLLEKMDKLNTNLYKSCDYEDYYDVAIELLQKNSENTKFWKQLHYIMSHNYRLWNGMDDDTKTYIKYKAHKVGC